MSSVVIRKIRIIQTFISKLIIKERAGYNSFTDNKKRFWTKFTSITSNKMSDIKAITYQRNSKLMLIKYKAQEVWYDK